MGTFATIATPFIWLAIVIFFFVLFVLGVLLPFFVYGIWSRVKKMEGKAIEISAMLTELTVEQETANKLSRQLLRTRKRCCQKNSP
jgi:preprotein translocase subunit Sec63